jgi:FdrA protein
VPAAIKVFPNTYVDSVVQLRGMRAMRELDGVEWASAAMATPANVDTVREKGVDEAQLTGVSSNDLFLVVRGASDHIVERALAAGESAILSARSDTEEARQQAAPRSLRDALQAQPQTDVAVVSVPGEYAALPAYQALSSGLHVLLFSDNVPLDKEISLKEFALRRGRLLMGPGAGTARLDGVGLGFANVVAPGGVGVVAAAGTGAQEAMVLLDRWAGGVGQVIGVGGRDMSSAVGGRMAQAAIAALCDDPATDVVLLVGKPPAPDVAERVLASATGKPLVAALIGLSTDLAVPPNVVLADTLEAGVLATLDVLGITRPDVTRTAGPPIPKARQRLSSERTLVRGLFSGGTLCYEALVILSRIVGEVRSNTPINEGWGLPAPDGSHQCLDLGEEEFTKGRPHPMIDTEARIEHLRQHAQDPNVAAIILDVVLGYGAHPDPAGVLAQDCASVMATGGPQIVAYVMGSEADPQGYATQRDRLVASGCIVTETAARAALAAAAIATNNPSLINR